MTRKSAMAVMPRTFVVSTPYVSIFYRDFDAANI
jgi:hypothetical protein